MRYALVSVLLLSANTVALAQDTPWDFEKLGNLSCPQFRALYGTSDYLNASGGLSAYLETTGRAGERLGSACNQMDYVKAECAQSRAPRVKDAVRSLLTKAQHGARLPRIPQCGA